MHVLVIEDEKELREAVVRRLRADGHGVDEASDGRSADAAMAVREPAVVVLDRMLPDGDSIELVRRWREGGLGVPILMLTALDQVGDRVAGLEAGADDYLVKPFAMAELLARVAALSRRQDVASPAQLRLGPLTLDTGRREVRRDGVLLPLRPKELVLLELLATHAGRVVTRAQIASACWDEAQEPSSNVEEVLIASLRRKLGRPSPIRTVRGAGYLLESDGDGPSDDE
ncbi:MAG: response regulator transcription factor [Acidobacteriota bacterium]